jgi:hypothetical protein
MIKELILLEGVTVEGNVIRNVPVCGLVSKNGYGYREAALKKAMPLYENADVFANHKDKRLVEDKIGWLSGIKYVDGRGLIAEKMTLNAKHPIYEQTIWWATHNPQKVGLSHSVQGTMSSDEKFVEDITGVESVDLVAKPATVGGLREEVSDKVVLDSRLSQSYDECTSILWDGKLADADKRAKLADVMSKLIEEISIKEETMIKWEEVKLEDLVKNCPALVSKIKEDAAAHEKSVQEALAKIPADKRGKLLEKQLREAATKEDRDALVEDRLELCNEKPVSGKAPVTAQEDDKGEDEVDEKALKEDVRKSLGLAE